LREFDVSLLANSVTSNHTHLLAEAPTTHAISRSPTPDYEKTVESKSIPLLFVNIQALTRMGRFEYAVWGDF
jgi:hypothetical protein